MASSLPSGETYIDGIGVGACGIDLHSSSVITSTGVALLSSSEGAVLDGDRSGYIAMSQDSLAVAIEGTTVEGNAVGAPSPEVTVLEVKGASVERKIVGIIQGVCTYKVTVIEGTFHIGIALIATGIFSGVNGHTVEYPCAFAPAEKHPLQKEAVQKCFSEALPEPWCAGNITVNIEDLPVDEFAVDTNNFPEAGRILKENHLAVPTDKLLHSGYCVYPVYKLTLENFFKEG